MLWIDEGADLYTASRRPVRLNVYRRWTRTYIDFAPFMGDCRSNQQG